MPTKADTYRQMSDHATQNLTAQIKDWTRFLLTAGRCYKYRFPDQVMIYAQRPEATACAEFDLWTRRMNRHIRRGSKGIALLRYRDGRIFLRYVFDVADTERREHSRDPMLWQYRDEYEPTVTSRLEEAFGIPGGDGLARQLITLAVQFADEHWHDFGDRIMLSVHDSSLDGLDGDNVALRFRNAVTVSLSFLLLARCGFDLDGYFTPEDFACIGEFDTRDTVLALGEAVSESAGVILRQAERAVKACMSGKSPAPAPASQTEERHPPVKDAPAAGPEKPAAGPVSPPEPEVPSPAAPGPPQEAPGRLAMQGHRREETALKTAPEPPEKTPTVPVPATNLETDPPVAPEPPQEAARQLAVPGYHEPQTALPRHPEAEQELSIQPAPAANFHITDEDLGGYGPKGRYVLNVEAIQTLRNVESEGRAAIDAEQEMLSRYTGWGAIPEAFDPDKPDWSEEYTELKSLLTEGEYASARASTLNAHFTPPVIIRAIYEALGGMGFTSGNILEPSCGTGNFFGCLPESMSASKLYGIELDGISGRIAKQLYPKARITIAGFETVNRKDFYDVAVGNVPFGDYKVHDPAYDKYGFSIHNYFLCKTLDQLRPGGVMAVVTSRYTMDSKDSTARKYLAERADLLGAIRLPNTAFKASAGTDVVADILFLQKLDEPNPALPDWVGTMENQDGYPVNVYFNDHPEMVLGCSGTESTRYGHDYTVYPAPGADLAQQLHEAVSRIHGKYEGPAGKEISLFPDEAPETVPAAPGVRDFSYAVVDGGIYYREGGTMTLQKLSAGTMARVKGLIALRDAVRETIDAQLDDCPDERLAELQANLDGTYDSFTAAYGLVSSRPNRLAFDKDGSYYLLCSLEILDDDGNLKRKADMFTARTIRRHVPAARAGTAQEALILSISEKARVDLDYMSGLTGKPAGAIVDELQGQIFRIPGSEPPRYVTAGEYLSGNVRRKLREAQRAAGRDPAYRPNVDALLRVQPRDLDASEIEIRLGATWVPVEYYQKFMLETFKTPPYLRDLVTVRYSPVTSEWSIENKNRVSRGDVMARATWGTERVSAYEILQDSLNLKDVQVKDTVQDPDGKERRVLNAKETTLAQQKQEAMRDAFVRWCFEDDPHRRQELVRVYNETMNCIRPREYDGSYLTLHDANPAVTLRPHQKDAIAHALLGGNLALCLPVGAGKTMTFAAIAMESKYLGLAHKPLVVLPGHIVRQVAAEWLRLYPASNLLVTSKKDFQPANRKKLIARIATGNWDAVLLSQSQFEKIPVSYERRKASIESQIAEITVAIAAEKEDSGSRLTVKGLAAMEKRLRVTLEKLDADWKKDRNVVDFESTGCDMLICDEAHYYKSLYLPTSLQVAGIPTIASQKCTDLKAKIDYLNEKNPGRNIILASGSIVSNTLAEVLVFQQYLQPERLRELGIGNLSSWISRFGEISSEIEVAPQGSGFIVKSRLRRFFNVGELLSIFKEVAILRTQDQLGLDIPKVERHVITCKPTEHQKAVMLKLAERAEKIHAGAVDPKTDNMLAVLNTGKALSIDQRLVNPAWPDDPRSKVNVCVREVLRHWEEGRAEKTVQLIFLDSSTPKPGGGFSLYRDIKDKLVASGVPESEIAFIHDAETDLAKQELFARVRSGAVRVFIGSTAKCGTGMNVQDKVQYLIHMDVPYRCSDNIQREGRAVRQGCEHDTVHIVNILTEGTTEAFSYEILQRKSAFVEQFLGGNGALRSCEDIGESTMTYAELKSIAVGDERVRERMKLDLDVTKLKIVRADWQSRKYRLEDRVLNYYPAEIRKAEAMVSGIQADIGVLDAHPLPADGFAGMTVRGAAYDEKAAAGQALMDAAAAISAIEPEEIGSYRGFRLSAYIDGFGYSKIVIRGKVAYTLEMGDSATGNIQRLDNALARIPDELAKARTALEDLRRQMENAREEAAKPFEHERELADKTMRLMALDAEIGMKERKTA